MQERNRAIWGREGPPITDREPHALLDKVNQTSWHEIDWDQADRDRLIQPLLLHTYDDREPVINEGWIRNVYRPQRQPNEWSTSWEPNSN